nr:DUF1071 domain-containing protein [Clostridia bacterium]
MMSVFEKLNKVNVNDHVETKNGLTYLSWAWAWAEVKKKFPDAMYEVKKFENGLPYVFDENTGYMVFTSVTVDGQTHEMWLPVMDANNEAMKNKPYEAQKKYKKVSVKAATMFDVNKAIMRCLTKNLAMFGLGLYIYAGEDLPEDASTAQEAESRQKNTESTEEQIPIRKQMGRYFREHALDSAVMMEEFGIVPGMPDDILEAKFELIKEEYGA